MEAHAELLSFQRCFCELCPMAVTMECFADLLVWEGVFLTETGVSFPDKRGMDKAQLE